MSAKRFRPANAPPRNRNKGVTIVTGSRINGTRTVVHQRADRDRHARDLEKKKELDLLQALPSAERAELLEHEERVAAHDAFDASQDTALNEVFGHPAPGEEGFDFSHGGAEGTFHDLAQAVFPTHRIDYRKRHHRVQLQVNSWRQQLPALTKAYLRWKADGPPKSGDEEVGQYGILVYSFRGVRYEALQTVPESTSINETLAFHGLIGSTPENPKVAFTFNFLESYRQLHRVCPRLSIEAMARALQHLHRQPRKPYLSRQLSSAFDAYLSIQRSVDGQVLQALEHNNPVSQAELVCAPCCYRLEEEIELRPSMLVACDGNNSLKLIDSTFRPGELRSDDRTLPSFRYLESNAVDVFKDDVARQQPSAVASSHVEAPAVVPTPGNVPAATNAAILTQPPLEAPNDDIAWLNAVELEEDMKGQLDACVERWRAAGPEARKKMVTLFAVSGIFLTVCRHGHVLVICDMIRSGELMKYPIANTNYLIEIYGKHIGQAYDIMCKFMKTLHRSSIASKVKDSGLIGVVPAFHGHAHSRSCQVWWHPRYLDGVGLEDFEECERLFSLTNELASGTRMCSAFHRRQQIVEYLNFHDHDKYAAHGTFLFGNYRAALRIISDSGYRLSLLEERLHTSAIDYERYLQEERAYFQGLLKEPLEVSQRFEYLEALERLQKAELESGAARAAYRAFNEAYDHGLSFEGNAGKIKSNYTRTANRLSLIDEEVARIEEVMGIMERWQPNSPEYMACRKELTERQYRRSLDELERLVVQRLMELTKLNMSGVGYKQREKIRKALQARQTAIQKALERYNHAAASLNPPRQTLTWTSLLELVQLGELALLQDTRVDIRQSAWAQPMHRQAAELHQEIKRAHEEIRRCNVELCRQVTYMVDNYNDYRTAIHANSVSAPDLATELQYRLDYQLAIDGEVAKKILAISNLRGFTGSVIPGTRIGRGVHQATDELPPWAIEVLGLEVIEIEESISGPHARSSGANVGGADNHATTSSNPSTAVRESVERVEELRTAPQDSRPHVESSLPAHVEQPQERQVGAMGLPLLPGNGQESTRSDSARPTTDVLPTGKRVKKVRRAMLPSSSLVNGCRKRKRAAQEDADSDDDDKSDDDLPEWHDTGIVEDQSEKLIEVLTAEHV